MYSRKTKATFNLFIGKRLNPSKWLGDLMCVCKQRWNATRL
jgi:hypothetical protein